MTLTAMTQEGVYNGPSIVEKVRLNPSSAEIEIARPFCYCSDDLIQKFAVQREFVDAPTGIHIPDDPFLGKAREAMKILTKESPGTNVSMNFFRSQFTIQSKYLGVGEGVADADLDPNI
jgi:hypothetical protein